MGPLRKYGDVNFAFLAKLPVMMSHLPGEDQPEDIFTMPLAAHRLKWRTRHFFSKNVHGPIVAETVRRKDSSANVGHSCRILFWRTRHRFSPTVQHCCGCSTSPLTREGNPAFALQVSELGIILCGIITLSFGFVVR